MRMCLSIIVATDENDGFSKDGGIPWRLKTDLQYFRKITLNNIVVMGRKTFETLGNKPLVNRENVVISSTLHNGDGYVVYPSILSFLQERGNENKTIFFIGGKDIYEFAINNLEISFIYKTVIHKNYECDLFFPKICSDKFANTSSPITFNEDGTNYHHEVYKWILEKN